MKLPTMVCHSFIYDMTCIKGLKSNILCIQSQRPLRSKVKNSCAPGIVHRTGRVTPFLMGME